MLQVEASVRRENVLFINKLPESAIADPSPFRLSHQLCLRAAHLNQLIESPANVADSFGSIDTRLSLLKNVRNGASPRQEPDPQNAFHQVIRKSQPVTLLSPIHLASVCLLGFANGTNST